MKRIRMDKKYLLLPIIISGIVLILVGTFYSSYAFTEPIKSVTITSEKLNYENTTPGSWKIEKSAKWISKDQARITFDLKTLHKMNSQNSDVILVMDNSQSMIGEKQERANRDAIEFSEYILSNSENRVALVSFHGLKASSWDFTSSKEEIRTRIEELESQGGSSYYGALRSVDSLLERYTPSENRNCVVLFLIGSYPNSDTPNEIGQFNYIKEQYPFVTINAVQYGMGSQIIEPIKKISDSQYYVDDNTTENMLYQANTTFSEYNKFQITDHINADYFEIEKEEDIKINYGEINFKQATQEVIWNVAPVRTGTSMQMSIDVKLKEEYINQAGFYPVGKQLKVQMGLEDIEEEVTSEKTPVLSNQYEVRYDENAPSGCVVGSQAATKNYFVYDQVSKDENIPTCEGYQFQGWRVIKGGATVVTDDYFIMPESDVELRAEWGKTSIVKSMVGEIYVAPIPKLQVADNKGTSGGSKFWTASERSFISKVVFQNTIQSIDNERKTYDVSADGNGGVIARLVKDPADSSMNILYIQGENKIIANEDSSYLFSKFSSLKSIEGLEYLDTSNVINMENMFAHCSNLTTLNLSNFNTPNLRNMESMFESCRNLTSLDLSGFDTSSVTNMESVFESCQKLTGLDLSSFDTSSVINMRSMFKYCTIENQLDLSSFDTSNVTNMEYMFGYTDIDHLDLSNFNTEKITTMAFMFQGCGVTSLNLSGFNTSNVTNMESMFESCEKLTSLDISNFDTFNVTNMEYMFSACKKLISLDLSSFDTSNVTTMQSMFNRTLALTTLDISNFNTANVTTMSYMFSEAKVLVNLDLSHFNTSNVTTMSDMFSDNNSLETLDISSFNTINVTDMSYMFEACKKLKVLDLRNFNTEKVTKMNSMFYNCIALESLDVSSFNTGKVKNMSSMFSRCDVLTTLDLSNFSTRNVSIMDSMFSGCGELTTMDLSKFNTRNLGSAMDMFKYCEKLSTTFTISNPDMIYAHNTFASNSTNPSSKIVINYTADTLSLVDQIIVDAPAYMANVVKGVAIDNYTITISGNNDVTPSSTKSFYDQEITLSVASENHRIKSFKMNGTLINGNKFLMPNANVTISDIEVVEIETIIIESEHDPYPNNLNDKIYGERTFEEATSLNVVLEYQTESVSYDWIYLYDQNGKQYGKYGGSTKRTQTITIPGNYIKITFNSDGSVNNFYGFKATITPIY